MNSDREKPLKATNNLKIKILFVCLIFILFLLLFTFNHELFNLLIKGDLKSVRRMLVGESYAYVITLLVMIVQNSFTVVPLILMIAINVSLFGFMNGFLWSWFTSVIASIIVFVCVRFIFQDWLIKKFKPEQIAIVAQKGFSYVFQARVFPFIPTSLINILAGLSSVRFNHFLFGTIFGNFIYFFLLSLIPAGVLSSSLNEYEIGVIILMIFLLYYGVRMLYKRKSKRAHIKKEENKHLEG